MVVNHVPLSLKPVEIACGNGTLNVDMFFATLFMCFKISRLFFFLFSTLHILLLLLLFCRRGVWGECDSTTGTKKRSTQIVQDKPSGSNGAACPVDEQVDPCDVDCIFTWPAFTACDVATGKQTRSPAVTGQPLNNGQACPPDEERPCPIDCKFTISEWTDCSVALGTQTRTVTIANGPQNGGSVCPPDETRKCDIDCISTYSEWATCNKKDGQQNRVVTITQQPKNNGVVCPLDENRDCPVDCENTWSNWTPDPCVTGGVDVQNRDVVITTPCKSEGNCASGFMNGGAACPPDETKDCGKTNCGFTWLAWSVCDPKTGKQQRKADVTVTPIAGGTACPLDEERDCPVDCVSTFTEWDVCNKETGKQGRTVIISTECQSGGRNNCPLGFLEGPNKQGQACPPDEIRECPVDCEYTWTDWGTCGVTGECLIIFGLFLDYFWIIFGLFLDYFWTMFGLFWIIFDSCILDLASN